jgi:hypothetical protein
VNGKYQAAGPEGEFEPGSRGRVLRNLLGITRVRDMNAAESQALELAQVAALDDYGPNHRFSADDVGIKGRPEAFRPGVKDMKARCRRLRNGSSVSSSTTIKPTWNWRSQSVTGRVT